jgi:hypothetical protein
MDPTSEIVTADSGAEFVDFLSQQREVSTDRNADWFDYLLDKDYWKMYPMWVMSKIDGEIWTIAAVQKHNFPNGVYRVMSRLYVKSAYRRPGDVASSRSASPTYVGNWPAKSTYLFPPMLDWMRSYNVKMFMTMEHARRHRNLSVISKYFNKNYGTNFAVAPNMYQTFSEEDNWRAWQVLTCEGEPDPNIPSITVEEWKRRFPEATLSTKV